MSMKGSMRKGRGLREALPFALLAGTGCGTAFAGEFELFGFDGSWQLQASYAVAMRLHDPDDRIINGPGSPEIPVPEFLKVPESNQYDDGDRNFDKHSLINNRVTLLGETYIGDEDFGLMLRGDVFYDDVYRRKNDNRSRDTLNQTEGNVHYTPVGPVDEFTDGAKSRLESRARLLDAYLSKSWYIGDEASLNLRVGRHVVAWGESLFFSGLALAQGRADATKANVPGSDVKSILLPTNQLSMQFSLTNDLALLGYYKFEFQPTELDPPGEYFSTADIIGPGAQFIYGLRNPLKLSNYADFNLLSRDPAQLVDLVVRFLAPNAPQGVAERVLGPLLNSLDALLPDIGLPIPAGLQPGTPDYINVARGPDNMPGSSGQWGAGSRYQLTPGLGVGLYHIRYSESVPLPVQNYGAATLLGAPDGTPILTTEQLGLPVPVSYNLTYADGVHMTAISLSTTAMGMNIGAEIGYRDGASVLVDLPSGLLGPVPTPTPAEIVQAQVSAIYSLTPQSAFGFKLWDSMSLVGELGYNKVLSVKQPCNPYGCDDKLTFSREAAALSTLAILSQKNVVNGWDLDAPVSFSTMLRGQSSLPGSFGPLGGERDHRASIGINMTYLQKLMVGVTWAGYFGTPHFKTNSSADRDYVGLNVKYSLE